MRNKAHIFPLMILWVITLSVNYIVPKYENTSDELLENSDFTVSLYGWDLESDNGAIKLENESVVLVSRSNRGPVGISKYIDNVMPGYYKFQSIYKTIDVTQGMLGWQQAQIFVLGYDEYGVKKYYDAYAMLKISGTSDGWVVDSKILYLDKNIERLVINARVASETGELNIKQIRLRAVQKNKVYIIIAYLLFFIWFLFLIWFFVNRSRYGIEIDYVKVIALVSVLVILLVNENILIMLLKMYCMAASNCNDDIKSIVHMKYVDTVVHFIAFFVVTILFLAKSYFNNQRQRIFIALIVFSSLTESLQLLTYSRKFELTDLIVDISAVCAGYVLYGMYKRLSNKHNNRIAL